eukprot:5688244-Pyramimonas_sp.AAC.1
MQAPLERATQTTKRTRFHSDKEGRAKTDCWFRQEGARKAQSAGRPLVDEANERIACKAAGSWAFSGVVASSTGYFHRAYTASALRLSVG